MALRAVVRGPDNERVFGGQPEPVVHARAVQRCSVMTTNVGFSAHPITGGVPQGATPPWCSAQGEAQGQCQEVEVVFRVPITRRACVIAGPLGAAGQVPEVEVRVHARPDLEA